MAKDLKNQSPVPGQDLTLVEVTPVEPKKKGESWLRRWKTRLSNLFNKVPITEDEVSEEIRARIRNQGSTENERLRAEIDQKRMQTERDARLLDSDIRKAELDVKLREEELLQRKQDRALAFLRAAKELGVKPHQITDENGNPFIYLEKIEPKLVDKDDID